MAVRALKFVTSKNYYDAIPLTLNSAVQDDRLLRLTDWLHGIYGEDFISIEPASEDASFRRYFRVAFSGGSAIAMDAPVDCESTEPFIRISRRFGSAGLNVPQILESDQKQGFVLLTDFGSTTYLQALSDDTADQLYSDAIDSLIRLQLATFDEPDFLPQYDAQLLIREMELFRTWYLGVHRAHDRRASDDAVLDRAFELLAQKALEQPRVWVHLDYHSRNLMRTESDNPGILDFQDARYGPITYDLVSLLRDCYIQWRPDQVGGWIVQYLRKARQHGLPVGSDESQFVEWFDWMGIQRHLKATGIFARLNNRDNKPQFLQDIPRVLSYIASVSDEYVQLHSLLALIERLAEAPG